jgi:hypothetical protein
LAGNLEKPLMSRVGYFRQKNYSLEDGIDGTTGMFRWNSGCSAEHKTLGIPFRTVPQRRKMLRILYHGTKIEANSGNSVLNHSAEQKTLGIPYCLEFRSGQKYPVYSVCWSRIFCISNFLHAIFFRSEPQNWLFRKPRNALEWALSSTE